MASTADGRTSDVGRRASDERAPSSDVRSSDPPTTSAAEATIAGVRAPALTIKDFQSNQDVRWCPGCGDYAILSSIQKVMPELGIPREKIVFVSGIGCSSRFPYYMNTYGFHTIHGRAPAIVTGLKMVNPELQVWLVTGDGDGLSIGGNHLIHILRRNVDTRILLFNNQIYGLTKGQISPTSPQGQVSKSTPVGSLGRPFNPLSVALAAGATFLARTLDRDPKHMMEVLRRAAAHKGTAFVEIFQNCIVFNNGAFFKYTEKETRPHSVVALEHGKPLVFGANRERGIRLNGLQLERVTIGENGVTEANLWVHNETDENPARAFLLAQMATDPSMPAPIGVFRAIRRPCYEDLFAERIAKAKAQKGEGDLEKLLNTGDTWVVS